MRARTSKVSPVVPNFMESKLDLDFGIEAGTHIDESQLADLGYACPRWDKRRLNTGYQLI